MVRALEERIGSALEAIREELFALERRGTLDRRPGPGAWTAREVAEHVALTDHYLLILANKIATKGLDRADRGELPQPPRPDGTARLEALAAREFAWSHPDHMTPSGNETVSALRERLRADLETSTELLRRTRDGQGSLHRIRMSVVPEDDRLDLYEYLTIVALHAERHLLQMRSAGG